MEHALLPVIPGQEEAFERAFDVAKHYIASSPGFKSLTLSRGVEQPSCYLLLVEWDSVEAHEVGFRQSDAFIPWKDLLHPFYAPFPIVEHFTPVATA